MIPSIDPFSLPIPVTTSSSSSTSTTATQPSSSSSTTLSLTNLTQNEHLNRRLSDSDRAHQILSKYLTSSTQGSPSLTLLLQKSLYRWMHNKITLSWQGEGAVAGLSYRIRTTLATLLSVSEYEPFLSGSALHYILMSSEAYRGKILRELNVPEGEAKWLMAYAKRTQLIPKPEDIDIKIYPTMDKVGAYRENVLEYLSHCFMASKMNSAATHMRLVSYLQSVTGLNVSHLPYEELVKAFIRETATCKEASPAGGSMGALSVLRLISPVALPSLKEGRSDVTIPLEFIEQAGARREQLYDHDYKLSLAPFVPTEIQFPLKLHLIGQVGVKGLVDLFTKRRHIVDTSIPLLGRDWRRLLRSVLMGQSFGNAEDVQLFNLGLQNEQDVGKCLQENLMAVWKAHQYDTKAIGYLIFNSCFLLRRCIKPERLQEIMQATLQHMAAYKGTDSMDQQPADLKPYLIALHDGLLPLPAILLLLQVRAYISLACESAPPSPCIELTEHNGDHSMAWQGDGYTLQIPLEFLAGVARTFPTKMSKLPPLMEELVECDQTLPLHIETDGTYLQLIAEKGVSSELLLGIANALPSGPLTTRLIVLALALNPTIALSSKQIGILLALDYEPTTQFKPSLLYDLQRVLISTVLKDLALPTPEDIIDWRRTWTEALVSSPLEPCQELALSLIAQEQDAAWLEHVLERTGRTHPTTAARILRQLWLNNSLEQNLVWKLLLPMIVEWQCQGKTPSIDTGNELLSLLENLPLPNSELLTQLLEECLQRSAERDPTKPIPMVRLSLLLFKRVKDPDFAINLLELTEKYRPDLTQTLLQRLHDEDRISPSTAWLALLRLALHRMDPHDTTEPSTFNERALYWIELPKMEPSSTSSSNARPPLSSLDSKGLGLAIALAVQTTFPNSPSQQTEALIYLSTWLLRRLGDEEVTQLFRTAADQLPVPRTILSQEHTAQHEMRLMRRLICRSEISFTQASQWIHLYSLLAIESDTSLRKLIQLLSHSNQSDSTKTIPEFLLELFHTRIESLNSTFSSTHEPAEGLYDPSTRMTTLRNSIPQISDPVLRCRLHLLSYRLYPAFFTPLKEALLLFASVAQWTPAAFDILRKDMLQAFEHFELGIHQPTLTELLSQLTLNDEKEWHRLWTQWCAQAKSSELRSVIPDLISKSTEPAPSTGGLIQHLALHDFSSAVQYYVNEYRPKPHHAQEGWNNLVILLSALPDAPEGVSPTTMNLLRKQLLLIQPSSSRGKSPAPISCESSVLRLALTTPTEECARMLAKLTRLIDSQYLKCNQTLYSTWSNLCTRLLQLDPIASCDHWISYMQRANLSADAIQAYTDTFLEAIKDQVIIPPVANCCLKLLKEGAISPPQRTLLTRNCIAYVSASLGEHATTSAPLEELLSNGDGGEMVYLAEEVVHRLLASGNKQQAISSLCQFIVRLSTNEQLARYSELLCSTIIQCSTEVACQDECISLLRRLLLISPTQSSDTLLPAIDSVLRLHPQLAQADLLFLITQAVERLPHTSSLTPLIAEASCSLQIWPEEFAQHMVAISQALLPSATLPAEVILAWTRRLLRLPGDHHPLVLEAFCAQLGQSASDLESREGPAQAAKLLEATIGNDPVLKHAVWRMIGSYWLALAERCIERDETKAALYLLQIATPESPFAETMARLATSACQKLCTAEDFHSGYQVLTTHAALISPDTLQWFIQMLVEKEKTLLAATALIKQYDHLASIPSVSDLIKMTLRGLNAQAGGFTVGLQLLRRYPQCAPECLTVAMEQLSINLPTAHILEAYTTLVECRAFVDDHLRCFQWTKLIALMGAKSLPEIASIVAPKFSDILFGNFTSPHIPHMQSIFLQALFRAAANVAQVHPSLATDMAKRLQALREDIQSLVSSSQFLPDKMSIDLDLALLLLRTDDPTLMKEGLVQAESCLMMYANLHRDITASPPGYLHQIVQVIHNEAGGLSRVQEITNALPKSVRYPLLRSECIAVLKAAYASGLDRIDFLNIAGQLLLAGVTEHANITAVALQHFLKSVSAADIDLLFKQGGESLLKGLARTLQGNPVVGQLLEIRYLQECIHPSLYLSLKDAYYQGIFLFNKVSDTEFTRHLHDWRGILPAIVDTPLAWTGAAPASFTEVLKQLTEAHYTLSISSQEYCDYLDVLINALPDAHYKGNPTSVIPGKKHHKLSLFSFVLTTASNAPHPNITATTLLRVFVGKKLLALLSAYQKLCISQKSPDNFIELNSLVYDFIESGTLQTYNLHEIAAQNVSTLDILRAASPLHSNPPKNYPKTTLYPDGEQNILSLMITSQLPSKWDGKKIAAAYQTLIQRLAKNLSSESANFMLYLLMRCTMAIGSKNALVMTPSISEILNALQQYCFSHARLPEQICQLNDTATAMQGNGFLSSALTLLNRLLCDLPSYPKHEFIHRLTQILTGVCKRWENQVMVLYQAGHHVVFQDPRTFYIASESAHKMLEIMLKADRSSAGITRFLKFLAECSSIRADAYHRDRGSTNTPAHWLSILTKLKEWDTKVHPKQFFLACQLWLVQLASCDPSLAEKQMLTFVQTGLFAKLPSKEITSCLADVNLICVERRLTKASGKSWNVEIQPNGEISVTQQTQGGGATSSS